MWSSDPAGAGAVPELRSTGGPQERPQSPQEALASGPDPVPGRAGRATPLALAPHGGGSARGWPALTAILALAACGFAPVYGPGGGAEGLRGTIRVEAPATRPEYDLVAQLESRLGQPTAAAYDLTYTLATREVAVGITPEQETTRYHVTGRLDFQLTDIGTGTVATSGEVETFTAYAATGSTVSAAAATEDAYRRLSVLLADQLVTRLQVTAGDWR
jgi:LPS-assembly lipoprotein